MFAPLVAICILGGACELFRRTDNKTYKTHDECVAATTEDVREIGEMLRARGLVATIGFKCEEGKDVL